MSKQTSLNISNMFQAKSFIDGERKSLVDSVPQLKRGQVWCRECGHTQKVNSEYSLKNGWPKCCGYTMTIDSPEEQNK